MAQIKFKGNPVKTSGTLPASGSSAPDFRLVKNDLSEATLESFSGKYKILNIFPSVDTGVCAMSVRKFNEKAASNPQAIVLNISMDLPFAQKRFCGAEGINNVEMLSAFRSTFADDYGVKLLDTPLAGLCSRAVVILSKDNKVVYSEQVADITQEPNYEAALKALS